MNVRSITTQPDWGNSPARTRRKTGEIFLNERYLKRKDLKADHWNLYMLHEEGHIVLDTRDEDIADEYAREKYLASGRSLRASVEAMTKVLDPRNPAHEQRIVAALLAAAKWDCEKNKQCSALHLINGTETMNDIETSFDLALTETLRAQSVAHPHSASVTDAFENLAGDECGARPVAQKCSGGPIKRKHCESTNKAALSAWTKCRDDAQKAAVAQAQLDAQREQVRTEAKSGADIMKAQLTAEQVLEQEETKRQAQSKTPLIVGIAIIAGVVIVAIVLLMKKPKP